MQLQSPQEVANDMKRLYRSRDERMIGGVAGGIAEYFEVDPTLVRIIFVLLLLPGFFPGILLYMILWAIIPPEPVGA